LEVKRAGGLVIIAVKYVTKKGSRLANVPQVSKKLQQLLQPIV
jgi:hypothetical protein